ncbi:MAG: DUF6443 domain-containing protein [Bacteroidales bacterium]
MPHPQGMNITNTFGYKILRYTMLTWLVLVAGLYSVTAQYPYTIEMSHKMIGNATIVAKLEIVHKPGFETNSGLDYDAYIDTNFVGNGTAYDPPIIPGNQVVSPSNMNYIITTTPQDTGYHTGIQHNCNQVTTDITYFDGLGRQYQDISVMASPDQKDIIKPYLYDAVGRPYADFLPYVSSTGQNGQFDGNYILNQKTFIGTIFGNDNKGFGFSKPLYEESSLSRILKQSAPGADWAFKPNALDQEHVMEMEFSVNDSDVAGWKIENNSFYSVTYSTGQLFVNITKNENKGSNQSITKEYKDKTGKVVLMENFNGNTWNKTRYIYDEFGLLRCVVPPKATTYNNPNLCYYYRYDGRHRLVSKKLPGADSVLMVYDKRDRLVMCQDGIMRAKEPAEQWILTCYDQFNRPVMSGIYEYFSLRSQVQMQDHYNNVVTNLNESINGHFNDTEHGYTRNVFSALCSSNCTYKVLSVIYYDDYLFALNNVGSDHYGFDSTNGLVDETEVIIPRNMPTGTKVKVMKREAEATLKDWIISAQYYNDQYRVIQTVADDPCLDGRDVISSKYSFTGNLEVQKTWHLAFKDTIEFTEKYVYDHRGRMLEHTLEGLPNQPKVMMASMHYNPVGQLVTKQIHSEESVGTYQPFIQKIDFQYNIRGWLTAINDPANTATKNDIFAMKLHYSDAIVGSSNAVQYNGNIASVNWATNHDQVKSAYAYGYDDLNRLTNGEYFHVTDNGYSHDGSFDEKNITYDENGNLQTLHRYGAGNIAIDFLNYTYLNNGNQISYIVDRTGDVPGVIDYPGGTTGNQGFWYDQNGNMLKSVDKGINSDIIYSYLNKPEELNFGNGEKLDYIFDGTGNKLAKIVKDGDALPENSLIYSGNFVYDLNRQLKYILTGEGRLVREYDSYLFEYFMKDHLGNTRATYAQAAPGLPQVSEYQHYYPFGMQLEALCYSSGADLVNNHLYNGKELQTDFGLQWYDYGARFYDPELGRWSVIDGKAEKYFPLSPYTYATNNPIRYLDPDGYKIVDANGHIMYTQGGGWTKYATADARRIGTGMMQSRTGTQQWNKMVGTAHPVTLTISSDDKTTTNTNGSKSYLLGITKNKLKVNPVTGKATVAKSDITIYEGTINTYINDTQLSNSDKAQSYQNNTTNNDERIAAVAGHESVHGTDQENIQQKADNKLKGATNNIETAPNQIEMKILNEIGLQKIKPIKPQKIELLPTIQPNIK